jgi:hypothetical protein
MTTDSNTPGKHLTLPRKADRSKIPAAMTMTKMMCSSLDLEVRRGDSKEDSEVGVGSTLDEAVASPSPTSLVTFPRAHSQQQCHRRQRNPTAASFIACSAPSISLAVTPHSLEPIGNAKLQQEATRFPPLLPSAQIRPHLVAFPRAHLLQHLNGRQC